MRKKNESLSQPVRSGMSNFGVELRDFPVA